MWWQTCSLQQSERLSEIKKQIVSTEHERILQQRKARVCSTSVVLHYIWENILFVSCVMCEIIYLLDVCGHILSSDKNKHKGLGLHSWWGFGALPIGWRSCRCRRRWRSRPCSGSPSPGTCSGPAAVPKRPWRPPRLSPDTLKHIKTC